MHLTRAEVGVPRQEAQVHEVKFCTAPDIASEAMIDLRNEALEGAVTRTRCGTPVVPAFGLDALGQGSGRGTGAVGKVMQLQARRRP